MAIVRGGHAQSGLDRALANALRAELDDILESGELYPGERDDFPEPYGPFDAAARPWQMPVGTPRKRPAADAPLRAALDELGGSGGDGTASPAAPVAGAPAPGVLSAGGPSSAATPGPAAAPVGRTLPGTPPPSPGTSDERAKAADAWRRKGRSWRHREGDTDATRARREFMFRDELTGVVLIHGVGRQTAGETLLHWTGAMVTALADAARADAARPEVERRLKPLAQPPRPVSDPVFRSNIDFSGETFPVVQVRVPGRTDVDESDPRASERRWLVSEAWWAAQVRPPTLRAMVEWLGEQGGLGRILQGIQNHMLGEGLLGNVARISLQALISVVVAFGMLLFTVLLGLARLLPFGPLKDFVALQAASGWLTGNFGGARTLLRDPTQSANVRTRLVATIKALRAYGCRHIVIVGHSGGTMVSLQTLTDPAYPRLRVDKLITHGEALNLAWRLESDAPDSERPHLPPGHRMGVDLARSQPQLLWRDFWATHDPASSGPPILPMGVEPPDEPYRFQAERVYNRMRISEDHNVFWEDDEHFVIPLIREIDAVTTDRSNSAFYSDAAESLLRARRKERVSLLALWRRATLALPLLAILAATLVSGGGRLLDAGRALRSAFDSVPFSAELTDLGRSLNELGGGAIAGWAPGLTWDRWYGLGVFVLQLLLMVGLALVIVPGRLDGLWLFRPRARVVVLAVDLAMGVGILAVIVFGWLLAGPSGEPVAPVLGLVGLGAVLFAIGWLGRWARAQIRSLEGSSSLGDRFQRGLLIVASAGFLALVPLVLIVAIVGVVLVLAGNAAEAGSEATRNLVLGSIVAVVAFQVIERLGVWRWDSWDGRERRALRRRPLEYPHREWVYFLAVAIAAIAVATALALVTAPDSALLVSSDAWLALAAALAAGVIVLSVGKDVVDNDVEMGAPLAIVPEVTGPAPGERAG